jgi:hypothetical protein
MNWFLLAVGSLLIKLSGYVVSPIALLFCKPEDEHLPAWAWLWDNPFDGINGDGDATSAWRGPEHANGRQREYKWRVLWMWRNAGYGYGKYAGAVLLEYPTAEGPDVSDQSGVRGFRLVTARALVTEKPRVAWERYIILKYPGLQWCFRMRMGWKLNSRVPGEIGMLVVSVSLAKRLKGAE